MQNTLTIHEQEKAIKITIRSETLKPIITAIKSYDPKFDINKFDKENQISLDLLHWLVQRYQDQMEHLIDDNMPTYYDDIADDGKDANADDNALKLIDYAD